MLFILILTACQNNSANVQIRSLFEKYPEAEEIAEVWSEAVELVEVEVEYSVEEKEVVEDSIVFQFESNEVVDTTLRVQCFIDHCEWDVYPYFGILFDNEKEEIYAIPIDQIKIDSTQALEAAINHSEFVFDNEQIEINLKLEYVPDTDHLIWFVISSTSTTAIYTEIDPFTGEIIDIDQGIRELIDVISVFEYYSTAQALAEDWDSEAALFFLRIDQRYEYAELTEKTILFYFEAYGNMRSSFSVECSEGQCSSEIKPLNFSQIGRGQNPLDMDQIIVGSVEALDIAVASAQFSLEGDENKISMFLSNEGEDDQIIWSVSNSNDFPTNRLWYVTVELDAVTGNVISISN